MADTIDFNQFVKDYENNNTNSTDTDNTDNTPQDGEDKEAENSYKPQDLPNAPIDTPKRDINTPIPDNYGSKLLNAPDPNDLPEIENVLNFGKSEKQKIAYFIKKQNEREMARGNKGRWRSVLNDRGEYQANYIDEYGKETPMAVANKKGISRADFEDFITDPVNIAMIALAPLAPELEVGSVMRLLASGARGLATNMTAGALGRTASEEVSNLQGIQNEGLKKSLLEGATEGGAGYVLGGIASKLAKATGLSKLASSGTSKIYDTIKNKIVPNSTVPQAVKDFFANPTNLTDSKSFINSLPEEIKKHLPDNYENFEVEPTIGQYISAIRKSLNTRNPNSLSPVEKAYKKAYSNDLIDNLLYQEDNNIFGVTKDSKKQFEDLQDSANSVLRNIPTSKFSDIDNLMEDLNKRFDSEKADVDAEWANANALHTDLSNSDLDRFMKNVFSSDLVKELRRPLTGETESSIRTKKLIDKLSQYLPRKATADEIITQLSKDPEIYNTLSKEYGNIDVDKILKRLYESGENKGIRDLINSKIDNSKIIPKQLTTEDLMSHRRDINSELNKVTSNDLGNPNKDPDAARLLTRYKRVFDNAFNSLEDSSDTVNAIRRALSKDAEFRAKYFDDEGNTKVKNFLQEIRGSIKNDNTLSNSLKGTNSLEGIKNKLKGIYSEEEFNNDIAPLLYNEYNKSLYNLLEDFTKNTPSAKLNILKNLGDILNKYGKTTINKMGGNEDVKEFNPTLAKKIQDLMKNIAPILDARLKSATSQENELRVVEKNLLKEPAFLAKVIITLMKPHKAPHIKGNSYTDLYNTLIGLRRAGMSNIFDRLLDIQRGDSIKPDEELGNTNDPYLKLLIKRLQNAQYK